MRAYFFGNMYLSSIQQGIQAAHVVADMFIKYRAIISEDYEWVPSDQLRKLESWAENDKTMVLLNGGYGSRIRDLCVFFDQSNNPYPWCHFFEGEDSLDGALTSVGIILPEKIYETARMLRQFRANMPDSPRSRILDDKILTIDPDNSWGITTEQTIVWEYTDWEIELCQRLNGFDLAR